MQKHMPMLKYIHSTHIHLKWNIHLALDEFNTRLLQTSIHVHSLNHLKLPWPHHTTKLKEDSDEGVECCVFLWNTPTFGTKPLPCGVLSLCTFVHLGPTFGPQVPWDNYFVALCRSTMVQCVPIKRSLGGSHTRGHVSNVSLPNHYLT